MECLRKCLKIAVQCVDTNAQFELHVEILNYFILYYRAKNEQVRVIRVVANLFDVLN